MKRACQVVALLVLLFWIVWGLTAKEQGNLAWGNLVTVADVESARLFGLEKPGAYVGLKNGKAISAVRGGLRLVLTLQDPALGFRAISHRMLTGAEGYTFTGTLAVLAVSLTGLVVIKVREKPSVSSSANQGSSA